MIASPSTGVLAAGEYRDLDEIPERIYDRSHYINTDGAEIVAVLKAVE